MEFLDGVPIDNPGAIAELGIDPAPVVEQTVQGFLLTAIRWGNFHGDVHAGNLLMLRDGRVGVIDWGIVARLDPDSHMFFRRLIEAALGDESRVGRHRRAHPSPVRRGDHGQHALDQGQVC